MMTALLQDPLAVILMRFMVGSTLLLGGVWCMERFGIIKNISLQESAWKGAIAASMVLLLPLPTLSDIEIQILTPAPEPTDVRPATDRPFQVSPNPESDSEGRSALRLPDQAEPRQSATRADAALVAGDQREVLAGTERPPVGAPDGFVLAAPGVWIIWLVYGVVGLALLLLSYRRAIVGLGGRSRVSLESREGRLLTRLVERTGVRAVPYLSRSEILKAPVCLMGREICLPGWAFDRLDDAKLESLLAHELAHLERRDPWMLLMLQVLTRLFFFQPLQRTARQRLMDLAELQADAWAAERMKSGRSVAEALFECAQNINDSQSPQWGFAMTGRPKILSERVGRLLQPTQGHRATMRGASLGVAALLVGGALGMPSVNLVEAASSSFADRGLEDTSEAQNRWTENPEANVRPPEGSELDRDAAASAQTSVRGFVLTAPAGRSLVQDTAPPAPDAVAVPKPPVPSPEPAPHAQKTKTKTKASKRDRGRHFLVEDGRGSMNFVSDGNSLSLSWRGAVGLSADLTQIKLLGDSGKIALSQSKDDRAWSYTQVKEGAREKTDFFIDGKKQEWSADGEAWLETVTADFIRRGFAAEQVVGSLLETKGVGAVLDQMDDLETSYATRVYVTALAGLTTLSSSDVKRVLKRVQGLESDYDKRLALTALYADADLDASSYKRLLTVARTIDSDYETRLLASSLIAGGRLSDDQLARLADLTATIESDYELRLLLNDVIENGDLTDYGLDVVVRATNKIASDYENRLLLSAALEESYLTDTQLARLVQAGHRHIDSNYELRVLLSEVADAHASKDAVVSEAVKGIAGLESSREARLAVASFAGSRGLSETSRRKLVDVAQRIESRQERTRALEALGEQSGR